MGRHHDLPSGPQKHPPAHIPAADEFANRLAAKIGGLESGLDFEVINRTASAHFIGGILIGDSPEKGVVASRRGAVQRGPSAKPLPTYEVREQQGEIAVRA